MNNTIKQSILDLIKSGYVTFATHKRGATTCNIYRPGESQPLISLHQRIVARYNIFEIDIRGGHVLTYRSSPLVRCKSQDIYDFYELVAAAKMRAAAITAQEMHARTASRQK